MSSDKSYNPTLEEVELTLKVLDFSLSEVINKISPAYSRASMAEVHNDRTHELQERLEVDDKRYRRDHLNATELVKLGWSIFREKMI